MSQTRVTESRRYDAKYDTTFIGPFTNIQMDPRVVATVSSTNVVAGQERFKYFRRPIMPRMSAIPPQVLLAPTVAQDPTVPMAEIAEPLVKNVEVQTIFRESEAQTVPYTPEFEVPEGEDPEVLILKGLTFENGLPLGQKELEMIGHAKAKREMEVNLPPFTDEASMLFRKKLMEQQEMREYKLRENEIDRRREIRLAQLQQALVERDESNVFLASQRVEAIRQTRMEERELALQKIRSKRIKVLRRLAHKRNLADPTMSDGTGRDIVNQYYDKASAVYAPIKRLGKDVPVDPQRYDVASRTAPLDNMSNIMALEGSVPHSLLASGDERHFSPNKDMSKTAPLGTRGGGRAAEERLTSAANRSLRNTKRDVEEMHLILLKKKRSAVSSARPQSTARGGGGGAAVGGASGGVAGGGSVGSVGIGAQERAATVGSEPGSRATSKGGSSLLSKKPHKGRPPTPDLVHSSKDDSAVATMIENQPLRAAVVLLQRLIRGRAVQNVMYEGRVRRAELIGELRGADEAMLQASQKSREQLDTEHWEQREEKIRESTVDAVAGGASSNLFQVLSQEQVSFKFQRKEGCE